MFSPIIFFDSLSRILLTPGTHRARLLGAQAVFAVIVIGTTYFLGNLALDGDQRTAVEGHLAETAADFSPRDDSAQVLFRDGQSNREIMRTKLENGETLGPFRTALLGVAPYIVALLALMSWVGKALFPDRRLRVPLLLAAFACALAPLLSMYFAWDFFRFAAQVQTSSTLIFLSLCGTAAAQGIQTRPPMGLLLLFGAAVVFGAATEPQFFDGATVRRPPFLDVIRYLVSALSGETALFAVPKL